MGESPITIEDRTNKLWSEPSVSVTATAFVDKLVSSGFQRFGCMFQRPTVGSGNFDAVMLAIPLNPAEKAKSGSTAQYSLGELLAMRVMLVGTGKRDYTATVNLIQLTDDTAAIYEPANSNHGVCNTVSINLPASKSQVASDGAPAPGK